MTKKEEERIQVFTDIHDQLAEYAKNNDDMFLMVSFSVSILSSCLETFQETGQWQALIKTTYLLTNLFHKVNEVDFPDKTGNGLKP